jgi:hypothetical protein
VLRVEKSHQQVPNLQTLAQVSVQRHYASLGRLLWELALRGSRDELLPEIAGQAAYRITPTLDLSGLDLSGSLASACEKLKRHTTSLREVMAQARPAPGETLHSSADSPRPIAD